MKEIKYWQLEQMEDSQLQAIANEKNKIGIATKTAMDAQTILYNRYHIEGADMRTKDVEAEYNGCKKQYLDDEDHLD